MRTETTSEQTPLREDPVAAADEGRTSTQVPFELLLPGLNKPEWVASLLHLSQNSHFISSELQLLVSSCPQDPAAPQTAQDAGGVSRGSAGAEVAVTAEGVSLPADQQKVLARSVMTLLLLTASWALLTTTDPVLRES